jgi:drug/metabolite transporter (DMT)-like permease
MSIVSPLVACGALVPFGVSLATGDRPGAAVLAGAVVALVGAVLASADEHRAAEVARRQAVLLALGAAVALGLFIEFLGLGSRHGAVLSALVGARIGSLAVLALWAGATRAPVRLSRDAVPAIIGLGLLDTFANGLFALATGRGFLSIVSVLGSLYPIATVIAAYALLGERISRPQRAGVLLALIGIALVAAG